MKEAILVAYGDHQEREESAHLPLLGEQGELLRLAGFPEKPGEEGAQNSFKCHRGWIPRIT